jgi:hypothetical protein
VSLKPQIFPPQIETLFSSLINCSPLRNNLRSEQIIPLCSRSTGYLFIIEINWENVSHSWGVVGALYFTTCASYDSHATTTNMLLPLSSWHNNLTMTSRFWRHFWQTHANCHASVDRAQPALLANAWRLAQVGQNGRQKTFAQAAM